MDKNEPNDDVAVCFDCGNVQPNQYVGNSAFFKAGMSPPCRYCGGVTGICKFKDTAEVVRQNKQKRGLL